MSTRTRQLLLLVACIAVVTLAFAVVWYSPENKTSPLNSSDQICEQLLVALDSCNFDEFVRLFEDQATALPELCRKQIFVNAAKQQAEMRILKLLIANGCDADVANDTGQIALMFAATNDDAPVIEYLLGIGASVNAGDHNGVTALMYASRAGAVDVIRQLVEGGADYTAQDLKGRTAWHWAASSVAVAPQVIDSLIKAGVPVNTVDNRGESPLMALLPNCNCDMVRGLIEAGASAATTDDLGHTALFALPCDEGLSQTELNCIVNLLLESGVPIDHASTVGKTALYRAVERGCLQVTESLLARGASCKVRHRPGAGLAPDVKILANTVATESPTARRKAILKLVNERCN